MHYIHAVMVLAILVLAGTAYNVSVNASQPTPALPVKEVETVPEVASVAAPRTEVIETIEKNERVETPAKTVPFYSQFTDISAPEWKKIGCGIASLAMIVDYYKPAVSVDVLLKQGIASDAYLESAGWTYKGLINVGSKYDLSGDSYDLAGASSASALATLKTYLADGPIIASVHYTFDPANPIPHLVVINKIEGDVVYYNDPAASTGDLHISTETFSKAWKKRFIVIRPV